MANKNEAASLETPPMVFPGERVVLLSHREYRLARAIGRGLDDYDILMRQPDDVGPEEGDRSEGERWMAVPANKYLKHRAIGWREAESLDDLPAKWQEAAAGRDPFAAPEPSQEGGE